MITKELVDCVSISQAVTPTAGAAGASDINGAVLDMANHEGVLVVVTFGAIASNAVTGIRAQQGDEDDLSDAADLLGTAQEVADDDGGKTFYINLHKPAKRYVRLVVDRATANATVAAATYQRYGGRTIPGTHGDGVSGESHVSPAEGAA